MSRDIINLKHSKDKLRKFEETNDFNYLESACFDLQKSKEALLNNIIELEVENTINICEDIEDKASKLFKMMSSNLK